MGVVEQGRGVIHSCLQKLFYCEIQWQISSGVAVEVDSQYELYKLFHPQSFTSSEVKVSKSIF